MQSKNSTSLPPIKFLLDSPIDDGHGPLFGFPVPNTPSPPLPPVNTYNRHQSLPSMSVQSTDSHHHHAVSKHTSLSNLAGSHASNSIRSLLSPPQSPELVTAQQSLDSYGARQVPRQEERYIPPQSVQQLPESQCACCVRPAPVYSSSHSPYNQSAGYQQHTYAAPVQQRYPSSPSPSPSSSTFPPVLYPTPISPYGRRSNLTMSPYPRLNGTMLPSASSIKHFNSHEQMSPNGSSSGNRYQCPYCSKRFSRPSSLRIHTYSHTGEKPFICTEPGCGRKFSVQSNMRRHLRVHRVGRPVKKTRYDGEVEGVKILSHNAPILRGY